MICFDPDRRRSKHITALRSLDLRSFTRLINALQSHVHAHAFTPILCQAAACTVAVAVALRLLCLHAASDNLSAPRTDPFCAYTNTSAPSPSSVIAFTPDVISAIIHPEDSLRMSIPDTVDVFLPAKVSRYYVSIVLSFSDLHSSPPGKR